MQLEQEKSDDELQLKIMLNAIHAFRDDCPVVGKPTLLKPRDYLTNKIDDVR